MFLAMVARAPVERRRVHVQQHHVEARSAATWAMPLPIRPAPITPSLLISAIPAAASYFLSSSASSSGITLNRSATRP